MDKLDFAVLNILQEQQATMKMTAISRKEILEALEINEKTLFRRIKVMMNLGYIKEGFKVGKSYTYFITENGVNTFREAMG
ncbi:winged helix-turn-helix domain-containing protein [Cellulosilyticum sp. I15G10I2]|uniref:winged helix-turn-helix domain-containing protein n=1 Tax=Cellulosilyticum sp. I15G10I2 TaxID=1892843 RepID=UPI00085C4D8B|nr:winged helix-turn-helix domain-containing protein [Cellulosilyticum sp. I15G10I2]